MDRMGDRIRRLRDQRGLRQIDLVIASGLGRTLIQDYEAGRKEPSPASLRKIAAALEVPVSVLDGSAEAVDLSADDESLLVGGEDHEALAKLHRLDARGRAIVMAALDAALREAGETGD